MEELLQEKKTEVSKGTAAGGTSCSVGGTLWMVAAVAKKVKVFRGKNMLNWL